MPSPGRSIWYRKLPSRASYTAVLLIPNRVRQTRRAVPRPSMVNGVNASRVVREDSGTTSRQYRGSGSDGSTEQIRLRGAPHVVRRYSRPFGPGRTSVSASDRKSTRLHSSHVSISYAVL